MLPLVTLEDRFAMRVGYGICTQMVWNLEIGKYEVLSETASPYEPPGDDIRLELVRPLADVKVA